MEAHLDSPLENSRDINMAPTGAWERTLRNTCRYLCDVPNGFSFLLHPKDEVSNKKTLLLRASYPAGGAIERRSNPECSSNHPFMSSCCRAYRETWGRVGESGSLGTRLWRVRLSSCLLAFCSITVLVRTVCCLASAP